MKELKKDRIDLLMDKAKSGNSKAQYELAQSFYKGHLVEKSLDQAKYWAFKAVSSGLTYAEAFYMSLYSKKD